MDFLLSEAGKRKDRSNEWTPENLKRLSQMEAYKMAFAEFCRDNEVPWNASAYEGYPLNHDLQSELEDPFELRRISFTEFYETMHRLAYEVANRCEAENKRIVLYLHNADVHGMPVWCALLLWPILSRFVIAIFTPYFHEYEQINEPYEIVCINDLVPNDSVFEQIRLRSNQPIVVLAFGEEKLIDTDLQRRIEFVRLNNTQTLEYDHIEETDEDRELYYFDHAIGNGLSAYISRHEELWKLIEDIFFTSDSPPEIPLFPSIASTREYVIFDERVTKDNRRYNNLFDYFYWRRESVLNPPRTGDDEDESDEYTTMYD